MLAQHNNMFTHNNMPAEQKIKQDQNTLDSGHAVASSNSARTLRSTPESDEENTKREGGYTLGSSLSTGTVTPHSSDE